MRLPTSDKTLRDYQSVHIEVGEDDTHYGIHLKVADDLYDRIHITAQGQYLVGDGTVPPTPIAAGPGGVETIEEGDNISVDASDPAHPIVTATIPAAQSSYIPTLVPSLYSQPDNTQAVFSVEIVLADGAEIRLGENSYLEGVA